MLSCLKLIVAFLLIFYMPEGLGKGPDVGNVDVVIYPRLQKDDNRYNDLVELLKMALEAGQKKFGPFEMSAAEDYMSENRLRQEVSSGSNKITLLWNAPTKSNVRHLLPVNFPLRQGLLGFRLLLINKKNQDKFSNVKSLEDFRKYNVLQGLNWKDVEVFKQNDIEVVLGSSYNGMFNMINIDRADSFSRGVTEIFKEYDLRKNELKNIVIDKKLLIFYPWPFYFLVNKNDIRLRNRLEYGLNILLKNGKFKKHIKKWFGESIKRAKLETRRMIRLKNENLWEGVPLDKKELWFSY